MRYLARSQRRIAEQDMGLIDALYNNEMHIAIRIDEGDSRNARLFHSVKIEPEAVGFVSQRFQILLKLSRARMRCGVLYRWAKTMRLLKGQRI